jgi:hypothetical protein
VAEIFAILEDFWYLSLLKMVFGVSLDEWMSQGGVHLLETFSLTYAWFVLVKLGFDLATFLVFGNENMHLSCLFHDIVGHKP